MGPFIGRWLRILERHIPMVKAAAGGSSTSAGIQVAKRVLADQVVMSVLFPLLCLGEMADGKGHHLD
jgi:protein Mpv17